MKAQNQLVVATREGALGARPISISGMNDHSNSNFFKVLSGVVKCEGSENEAREMLFDFLRQEKSIADKTQILADFVEDNFEKFRNELSELFDEINIVDILYEYKNENDYLGKIFTVAKFHYVIEDIFRVTLTKSNLLGTLKLLVEAGVVIDKISAGGRLPIHYAAESGNVAAMEYCVSRGNDINAKDHIDRLPIHYAAESGNVAAMEYCVSRGNDINAEASFSKFPIHYAAESGNVATMEYCISRGGDINTKCRFDMLPLHYATRSGNVAAMEYCVRIGSNVNAKDHYNMLPIHYAASSGNVAAMEYCVSQGGDINAQDLFGKSPIHYAAESGNVAAMEYCVSQGSDINAQDLSDSLPIHYAVQSKYDNVSKVLYLLKLKAFVPENLKYYEAVKEAEKLLAAEDQILHHKQESDGADETLPQGNLEQKSFDDQNSEASTLDTDLSGADAAAILQ